MARFHEEFVVFASSFLGSWLAAARTLANGIAGDQCEHLIDELLLLAR